MALIVLQITWKLPGSTPGATLGLRRETYGPWEGRDDLSHMERIRQFLTSWQSIHGEFTEALVSVVQSPDAAAPTEGERR